MQEVPQKDIRLESRNTNRINRKKSQYHGDMSVMAENLSPPDSLENTNPPEYLKKQA